MGQQGAVRKLGGFLQPILCQMQPQPQVLLSDAEFETLIEQIREKL